MSKTRFLLFRAFILLTLYDWAYGSPEATLRFVHVLYRHGDRTPIHTFPADVNNTESTWPQGFGEITTLGIQQQYQLGEWLHERYKGFIDDRFQNGQIHIQSTDYNRTIMSALANLAGLFALNPDVIPDVHGWSPVPVHTTPEFGSALALLENSQKCQEYRDQDQAFRKKFAESMAYYDEKYADFLQFIVDKSGSPNCSSIVTCDVWDSLVCEKAHQNSTHRRWSDWVNDTVFDQIQQLYFLRLPYEADGPFYKTLGGLLLQDIITRLQSVISDDTSTLRMFVYSAHDTWVMALLNIMGAFNGISPPYTSTVLLELHNVDGNYHVNLFYKNSTSDVYPLLIDGCDSNCAFDSFVSGSQSYIDYSMNLCTIDTFNSWLAPATRFIALISIGLLLAVVYVTVKYCYALKNVNRFTRVHVNGSTKQIPLAYSSLLDNASVSSQSEDEF